jgi:hypothetical protein
MLCIVTTRRFVAVVVPLGALAPSPAVRIQALSLSTRLQFDDLAFHEIIAMQTESVTRRTAPSLADGDFLQRRAMIEGRTKTRK